MVLVVQGWSVGLQADLPKSRGPAVVPGTRGQCRAPSQVALDATQGSGGDLAPGLLATSAAASRAGCAASALHRAVLLSLFVLDLFIFPKARAFLRHILTGRYQKVAVQLKTKRKREQWLSGDVLGAESSFIS